MASSLTHSPNARARVPTHDLAHGPPIRSPRLGGFGLGPGAARPGRGGPGRSGPGRADLRSGALGSGPLRAARLSRHGWGRGVEPLHKARLAAGGVIRVQHALRHRSVQSGDGDRRQLQHIAIGLGESAAELGDLCLNGRPDRSIALGANGAALRVFLAREYVSQRSSSGWGSARG